MMSRLGATGCHNLVHVLHVVLVAPEIAPNTGNVIRLCANTGATLHLIEPLGFSLSERALRRAGLDYHELVSVHIHPNLDACLQSLSLTTQQCFALSAGAVRRYDEVRYTASDVVIFGAEREGLPRVVLDRFAPEHCLRIPMRPGNRSLNLANAVAAVVYEAWRQVAFAGSGEGGKIAETPSSPPFGAGG